MFKNFISSQFHFFKKMFCQVSFWLVSFLSRKVSKMFTRFLLSQCVTLFWIFEIGSCGAIVAFSSFFFRRVTRSVIVTFYLKKHNNFYYIMNDINF